VIQALDRQEVGQDGVSSTVKEIEALIGKGRVRSILDIKDLMTWLEKMSMRKKIYTTVDSVMA